MVFQRPLPRKAPTPLIMSRAFTFLPGRGRLIFNSVRIRRVLLPPHFRSIVQGIEFRFSAAPNIHFSEIVFWKDGRAGEWIEISVCHFSQRVACGLGSEVRHYVRLERGENVVSNLRSDEDVETELLLSTGRGLERIAADLMIPEHVIVMNRPQRNPVCPASGDVPRRAHRPARRATAETGRKVGFMAVVPFRFVIWFKTEQLRQVGSQRRNQRNPSSLTLVAPVRHMSPSRSCP
jgi:hypothetical protein